MAKTTELALGAALAIVAAYAVFGRTSSTPPVTIATAASQVDWIAAAPGRVEPKSGEVRIGAGIIGRVTQVLVQINSKVEEDELLMRLDDDESRARLAAAEAEAAMRMRERNAVPVVAGREDAVKAEDGVYSAERAVTGARYELDYALAARRKNTGGESGVTEARRRLSDAKDQLNRERIAYATSQTKANLPAPTALESALTAARANVTMADALLEKSRIRSAAAGTVLQLGAKVGEFVGPGGEQPLAVIGDISVLRVKAEVDDGDIAKLRTGQRAYVRSINFPGRDFEGHIVALAPTLAAPRIGGRGPRRLTDVEVLEVTIDLDGSAQLLPGMRVDTFFRRD